jgi:hypothetical protein
VRSIWPKVFVTALLTGLTVVAYGGAFRGWFLPEPLEKPVSLREGSVRTGSTGHRLFFIGGRSHAGGGYRGGK